MTDHFSTLRSLMNQPRLAYHQRQALLHLVAQAAKTIPEQLEHQWWPYMTGFPHHFQFGFETYDAIQHIENTLSLLPFARFNLKIYLDDVETLRAICQHPCFKAVDGLNLWLLKANPTKTQHIIDALLDLDACAHLRALELQLPMTPHAVSLLTNTPSLQNLHTLGLADCQLDHHHIQILCDTPHLKNVRKLNLSDNHIDTHCVDLLAHCPNLPNLTCLDLSYNPIEDDDLALLARTQTLTALSALYFRECDLHDRGISHLLASETITQLKALDLYETHMTDILTVMADSPKTHALRLLDLSCCRATPQAIETFFANATLPHLQYLDLSATELTDQTIINLAKSPSMASLRVLDLSFNTLSSAAIEAIAGTEHSKNLYALSLMSTDLNLHSAKALAQSPHLKHITYLDYQPFEGDLPDGVEDILLDAPHLQRTTKHHFEVDWQKIYEDIERHIYHLDN